MKICLTSFAPPWFFGPYGQQLKLLGNYLNDKGFDIYYLCLGLELPKKIYTLNNLLENIKEQVNNEDKNILSKFKFLGGIKQLKNFVLISNINDILDKFNINVIITCMDLLKLCYDEDFKIKSLAWYPNHFSPIDKYNKRLLNMFSEIISLSPTDYTLLKNTFQNKNIHYIPHIIDFKRNYKGKDNLRQKYNIPKDKFVIFINCGNYDTQNRKSLDISLLAFEKFLKKNDGLLFIHSYNVRKIDVNNYYTPLNGFLIIEDILEQLSIPEEKIILHEDIINYDDVLDMIEMSDVLLQPSKSEGFGLPILEAQLIGIPVITSRFGAMYDYTFNGISVDIVQKCYELSSSGFWITPSIGGITNALKKIKNNQFENKKNYAINQIKNEMSIKTVGNKFIEIINDNNFIKPIKMQFKLFEIVSYDDNYYYINKKKYSKINSNQINSKWIIFMKDGLKCKKDMIKTILLKDSDKDLIALLTDYNGKVYPSQDNLQNGNFDYSKVNYAIKTKYFNVLIQANILTKYKSGFILRNFINKLNKTIVPFTIFFQ